MPRFLPLIFILIIALGLISTSNNPKSSHSTSTDKSIEETFLSLDSVWTPGNKQKFGLHPYDNYLWIKNGEITFMVEPVRGKSFRGLINGGKIEEKNGNKITSFTVRNAKMKVEITDLGHDRFEIFTYNYLDKYERLFTAFWVDISKIQFSEDE